MKELRGTRQKCREAPGALALPPGVPEPPPGLNKAARAIWLELAADEAWRVVLSKPDAFGLELLVKHMALERRFMAAAEKSPVVKTPYGPKPNPAASEARKEGALVKQLLAEFGLTPSARTRVSAPPKAKGDEGDTAAGFLFGGGLQVVKGGKGG